MLKKFLKVIGKKSYTMKKLLKYTQSSMEEDNELFLSNIVLSENEKILLKLYMSSPLIQQQDQMVFHPHYWSTALLS